MEIGIGIRDLDQGLELRLGIGIGGYWDLGLPLGLRIRYWGVEIGIGDWVRGFGLRFGIWIGD